MIGLNNSENHGSLENYSLSNQSINKGASNRDFYIGLSLAILSSFFIGSSFILKKKGLIKLSNTFSDLSNESKKGLRAGQGGHGYLKEWLWWSGFLTMGLGELCNFAAYGFVPATLVTPLGALSVLVSAIMATYFLDEKLNAIGKIGCSLTAIGSTVMVIHAPKEGEINSLRELLNKLMEIEFVIFVMISLVSLYVLIYVLAPQYGNTNILVYILICSILGSYTVMCCKGISLGLKELINQKPTISYTYTSLFVFIAMLCIVVQINYLNKALDVFNTALVTTVYYVLFSLSVMIVSSILFKELLNVSFQDFVGCICGFSTIICALCLIHFFKSDVDVENFSSSFKIEKSIKNEDLIVNNSNNEINDKEKSSKLNQNNNEFELNSDIGLFANLIKKTDPSNILMENSDIYEPSFSPTSSRNVTFKGLNNQKNNKKPNFSLFNYVNENLKNLESKYLNRFRNQDFNNYNYNQLITNESNDSQDFEDNMLHKNNNFNNLESGNAKKSINYRHLTSKNETELISSLIENKVVNDSE